MDVEHCKDNENTKLKKKQNNRKSEINTRKVKQVKQNNLKGKGKTKKLASPIQVKSKKQPNKKQQAKKPIKKQKIQEEQESDEDEEEDEEDDMEDEDDDEEDDDEEEEEDDFDDNPKKKQKQQKKTKVQKKQQVKKVKALQPKKKTQKEINKEYGKNSYFSNFSGMDYKEARIQRAKTERIYLLRAERVNQNEWSFTVQGQSGKNYLIEASRNRLKCRCMDCSLRRKTCKHLLFIVCKIAKSDKLLNQMSTNLKLNDKQYDMLDMALLQRLKKRIEASKPKQKKEKQEKEDQKIDLGEDKDCPICFDDMEGEKLSQCVQGCKKYFHQTCIELWCKRNTNCPLCRTEWQEDGDDDSQENQLGDNQNVKYGGKAMQKLQIVNIRDDQDLDDEDDEF